MDKKDILKELEKNYEKLKEEGKIVPTLEDLDRIFFIKDAVLKDGFVSENLGRQICYRVVETYMGWNEYLHSLIMPIPQNILNMSESKIFNQEEKKEIVELMKKIMEISSKNSVVGLTRDKEGEARFIDYAVEFWNSEFKEKLVKLMEKINKEWANKEQGELIE